ncbi:MAG: hypothetical protein Q8N88_00060, partial [Nanoarchaeota archaeon]|nr:hypothetical protein [Nanoarchaeota archaeon]
MRKRLSLLVIILLLITFISLTVSDIFSVAHEIKTANGKQLGDTLKINPIQESSQEIKITSKLEVSEQKPSQEIKYFLDSNISGQDIKRVGDNYTFSLISNQSQIESFDVMSKNKSLDSSTKKTSQIQIYYDFSSKKAEKVKLSEFTVPETGLPFEKKKEQPIIHPTLEETIVLKANNEVKKKREAMANISFDKTTPKIISQKEIKSEKVLEMLEKDPEFKEVYDYAKELGLGKLNYSIGVDYDDGKKATIVMLSNESSLDITNKRLTFLVNVINNEGAFKKSFLMEIEEENETRILKIFDQEGGIIINVSDFTMLSSWGHHSCAYWDCVWYGIQWIEENMGIPWICIDICWGLAPTGPV